MGTACLPPLSGSTDDRGQSIALGQSGLAFRTDYALDLWVPGAMIHTTRRREPRHFCSLVIKRLAEGEAVLS